MAARLAPDNVRRTHQSLPHVVADAPWSDEVVLRQARKYAVAAMRGEDTKRNLKHAWDRCEANGVAQKSGYTQQGRAAHCVPPHCILQPFNRLGEIRGRSYEN